jgi:adenylate cyclase class IV
MPSGLFDPQDLEHQVLFRLTTYDPTTITDALIEEVIAEQLTIITKRLEPIQDSLPYLFRGLTGQARDLNRNRRLELKNINGSLVAIGEGCSFEVEFRKIDDRELIELFTEKLHYIHAGRHKGDAFGFFFKGDAIPWGIETIEPSIITKKYKRDALLAHGIDPHKAVEITRLYLLPGSPRNAISILDGLVSKHYKNLGIEAMYTTTMPTYAKTKGATTAGGMKDVLLVKELSHHFKRTDINGKSQYVHAVNVGLSDATVMTTHPAFPTLYTVETFMRLNKNREIQPLDVLKSKTIYINKSSRNETLSKEAKFKIEAVDACLEMLNEVAKFKETIYLHDQFWGSGRKPKLRLRKIYKAGSLTIDVSCKYRISAKNHIRTEVHEKIYEGKNMRAAEQVIEERGDYRRENSYEKMRTIYTLNEVALRLDVYPFGVYLEIEGSKVAIEEVAKLLHLNQENSITATADETYLEWTAHQKFPELWNIRFGLEKGGVHA